LSTGEFQFEEVPRVEDIKVMFHALKKPGGLKGQILNPIPLTFKSLK